MRNLWAFRQAIQLASVGVSIVCVGGASLAQGPVPSSAEKPAAVEQSAASAQLTEGLLDLLREPNSAAPKKPPTEVTVPDVAGNNARRAPGSPAYQPPPPGASPSRGEDVGSRPVDPLTEVQSSMSQAANWLREQVAVNRTTQLQGDVLARLDELIEQLQSQQTKSAMRSESQQRESRASSGQTQPAGAQKLSGRNENKPSSTGDQSRGTEAGSTSTQRAGNLPNEPGTTDASQGTGTSPEGPAVLGPVRGRSAIVDLKDPAALQRSAWGNLPERVREQMQSRMVERFLPSYREDIEAYYRALNK